MNMQSIGGRLWGLFTLQLVAAVTIFGMSAYNIAQLDEQGQDIANRRIQLIRDINKIMYRMLDNKTELLLALQHDPHSVLAAHDHPMERHFENLAKNKADIDEMLAEMQSNVHSEEGRKLIGEFISAREAYVRDGLVPVMALLREGKFLEANNYRRDHLDPLLAKALEIGHQDAAHENKASEEAALKAHDGAVSARNWSIALMLASAVAAFFIAWRVIGGVTSTSTALRDVMTRTAADGDLTRRAQVKGKDEVAAIAESFNHLMSNIATSMMAVRDSALVIAEASQSLAHSGGEIRTSSQAQSEAASSTAAAVEQMTVSIHSVSQNASDVRSLSQKSLESTEEGNRSTGQMIAEIGHIEQSVNQIAVQVREFLSSAQTIAGMTQQVKDIADQTNLLALNAAIEAARAGEQGRGFAVVADEVRKLAEKSAQSANEIERITSALSGQSNDVERAIDSGVQSIQSTQQHVGMVSEILQQAGQSVRQATAGVNDISGSVAEQSKASNEVARHIESIAQMAEENHAAVEHANNDIARLEAVADELRSTVSKFKV